MCVYKCQFSKVVGVQLKITNVDSQRVISREITEKSEYYVAKNYSDTIKNEKSASKLITQQLSDQILDFIILSIGN